MDNGKIKSKVHFFNRIGVALIPCKEEYKEAKLTEQLWHSANELELFKQQTKEQHAAYRKQKKYGPEIQDKAMAQELYADPDWCELIDNELENSNNIGYK